MKTPKILASSKIPSVPIHHVIFFATFGFLTAHIVIGSNILALPFAILAAGIPETLIAIAFKLADGLRGGDFFSRISDCGFWVLLRTDEASAAGVIKRLDLPRHDDLTINLVARKYLDYSAWIDAIDSQHFK